VLLLIVAVLYQLDKERMNKRRLIQQTRSQIGLSLHNEVSTTLSKINVLSEIAKLKADKDIDQSKEYIDQISSKSRYMIEAMDDMLWSIDPANDSMAKTILRIKELTEGVQSAYRVEIDLIVAHKVEQLQLDMKLRHDLFFFYKEALQYLVEHISCKQVFVSIKQVRSKLVIEILSECDCEVTEFAMQFKQALKKRVEELSSTVDVLADNKRFSVVLSVVV
jgi:glucose-6-phosphate-specific signal transduction histidine kinase